MIGELVGLSINTVFTDGISTPSLKISTVNIICKSSLSLSKHFIYSLLFSIESDPLRAILFIPLLLNYVNSSYFKLPTHINLL